MKILTGVPFEQQLIFVGLMIFFTTLMPGCEADIFSDDFGRRFEPTLKPLANGHCDPTNISLLEANPKRVVVASCLTARDGCHHPRLKQLQYEPKQNHLTLTVHEVDTSSPDLGCTMAFIDRPYKIIIPRRQPINTITIRQNAVQGPQKNSIQAKSN